MNKRWMETHLRYMKHHDTCERCWRELRNSVRITSPYKPQLREAVEMAKKQEPVKRYDAHEGQMMWMDGKVVGVDIPVEEFFNEEWPKYVASRHFNVADLRAAYEEGLSDAANSGDREKMFDDFVERLLNRRDTMRKKKPR